MRLSTFSALRRDREQAVWAFSETVVVVVHSSVSTATVHVM
jgi:hypothetical protein